MKVSVLPVSYFEEIIAGRMTIGDWAREGVSLGLDAIDISIRFLIRRDSAFLSRFRREVEDVGISICGSSTYPDFTHPDAEERKRQRRKIGEDIRALAEVGTRIVRVTAGQAHPGLAKNDGLAWAVEGLTTAQKAAEQCGVSVVLENHAKPGVWEYPDFDFPTRNFLALAERLKDTPIGIQFDTANPVAFGDDPVQLLERVLDRVLVIHVADTKRIGALEPTVIGTGEVPFRQIFRILQKARYDKWLTIEEASGTGADGVAKAVEFVRESFQG